MDFKEHLEKIFLSEEEIPEEFALPGEVHQRNYLSNGEMIQWNGDVHEVYSPVCVRTHDGLKRMLIGTYPVCTQKEAMAALDAAVAAYNTDVENGQLWELQTGLLVSRILQKK